VPELRALLSSVVPEVGAFVPPSVVPPELK
jgi:hypothetical protein